MLIQEQQGIIQNIFTKPVSLVGLFFAASYSKTALVFWSLKVKANKLTLLWNRNRIDSPAIVLKKDQLPTHLWWVVVDKSLSLLVTLK